MCISLGFVKHSGKYVTALRLKRGPGKKRKNLHFKGHLELKLSAGTFISGRISLTTAKCVASKQSSGG